MADLKLLCVRGSTDRKRRFGVFDREHFSDADADADSDSGSAIAAFRPHA